MAGAFTNYLENKLLDLTLKQVAYLPAGCYVALYGSSPTETGAGGAECSGGSYARQSVTFSAAAEGQTSNSGVITFPAATAPSWGALTHFALFDAVSAGNMLYYSTLTTPKTISAGDVVRFNVGTLSVSLD